MKKKQNNLGFLIAIIIAILIPLACGSKPTTVHENRPVTLHPGTTDTIVVVLDKGEKFINFSMGWDSYEVWISTKDSLGEIKIRQLVGCSFAFMGEIKIIERK
jgi:hypothetical protein